MKNICCVRNKQDATNSTQQETIRSSETEKYQSRTIVATLKLGKQKSLFRDSVDVILIRSLFKKLVQKDP